MGRAYSCWMLNCWYITWPVGFKRLSTLTGKSAHCGEEPMILQTIRYNHINLLGPYLLHASGSFDVELKEGKNTVRLAAPSGTAKCLTVCILRESYITYLLNCAHPDSFAKNNFYWPQRFLWELRALTAAVKPVTDCALWLFDSSLPTAPFIPVAKAVDE